MDKKLLKKRPLGPLNAKMTKTATLGSAKPLDSNEFRGGGAQKLTFSPGLGQR